MNKILVIGSNGQVGGSLKKSLNNIGIFLSRSELDLANISSIPKILDNYPCDIIINCAAYTAVDLAETQNSLAYDINAHAPGEIANYCAKNNIKLIHYSTDYVFDGKKQGDWHEDDQVNPLGIYGKSKLLGEENILKSGCDHLILRTSWLYNNHGKNFLNTMLRLASEKETIQVVSDQFGCPTYTDDLANATLEIIEKSLDFTKFPTGIYHLSNQGYTSWYGFAKEIFAKSGNNHQLKLKNLIAISSDQYKTPASRPSNSILCCDKAWNVFGVRMQNWINALDDCIHSRNLL